MTASGAPVAGVILAAGASVRLGPPKQLLRLRGETLIHRTARLACAAGLTPVQVVVGYRGDEVSAAVGDLGDTVAVAANPRLAAGYGRLTGLWHCQPAIGRRRAGDGH